MKKHLLFVLLLALLLGACRGRPETTPAQTTPQTSPTQAAPATGLRVQTEVVGDPALGNVPVRVYVLDGNDGVTGATVQVTGDMTHAGMIPVIADTVETEPGIYEADTFEFTMAGDWILTVSGTLPDGRRINDELMVTVPGR